MGLISRIFGLGEAARGIGSAVEGVAGVFTEHRTERLRADHAARMAAHNQFGAEFTHAPVGWFDGFVNGLNRLPRPGMALGTLGLFAFAMIDPGAFARRMEGLAAVPEPLWWLLGAVVSFYFGARELHHSRRGGFTAPAAMRPTPDRPTRSVADENPIVAAHLARQAE